MSESNDIEGVVAALDQQASDLDNAAALVQQLGEYGTINAAHGAMIAAREDVVSAKEYEAEAARYPGTRREEHLLEEARNLRGDAAFKLGRVSEHIEQFQQGMLSTKDTLDATQGGVGRVMETTHTTYGATAAASIGRTAISIDIAIAPTEEAKRLMPTADSEPHEFDEATELIGAASNASSEVTNSMLQAAQDVRAWGDHERGGSGGGYSYPSQPAHPTDSYDQTRPHTDKPPVSSVPTPTASPTPRQEPENPTPSHEPVASPGERHDPPQQTDGNQVSATDPPANHGTATIPGTDHNYDPSIGDALDPNVDPQEQARRDQVDKVRNLPFSKGMKNMRYVDTEATDGMGPPGEVTTPRPARDYHFRPPDFYRGPLNNGKTEQESLDDAMREIGDRTGQSIRPDGTAFTPMRPIPYLGKTLNGPQFEAINQKLGELDHDVKQIDPSLGLQHLAAYNYLDAKSRSQIMNLPIEKFNQWRDLCEAKNSYMGGVYQQTEATDRELELPEGTFNTPPYISAHHQKACTATTFRMIYGDVTNRYLDDASTDKAGSHLEGPHSKSVHNHTLLNILETQEFKNSHEKDMVRTRLFSGLDLTTLGKMAERLKAADPDIKVHIAANVRTASMQDQNVWHTVVVTGVTKDYVRVHDPRDEVGPNAWIPKWRFLRRWASAYNQGYLVISR